MSDSCTHGRESWYCDQCSIDHVSKLEEQVKWFESELKGTQQELMDAQSLIEELETVLKTSRLERYRLIWASKSWRYRFWSRVYHSIVLFQYRYTGWLPAWIRGKR